MARSPHAPDRTKKEERQPKEVAIKAPKVGAIEVAKKSMHSSNAADWGPNKCLHHPTPWPWDLGHEGWMGYDYDRIKRDQSPNTHMT